MAPDLSRQAILQAFDRLYEYEPLPAELVAHELGFDEAVARERLGELPAAGDLTHAVTDADEDYWWAEVAPALERKDG